MFLDTNVYSFELMNVILKQNNLYHDFFHPFGSKPSLKLRKLLNIHIRLLVFDLIKL